MIKIISRNALILASFALVSVGLISLTYFITRDTITSEKKAALVRTLDQLVDADLYNNDVYKDCTLLTSSETEQHLRAYRMRNDDLPVAAVLESIAPNGYSGKIHMVIGIYADGTISGVRITEHHETPGLGDKIELRKSDWVLGFNDKSLIEPNISQWTVKKDGGDFDAFTGATITPRAVVQQVAKTLQYFNENQVVIFDGANNCHGGTNE